MRSFVKKFISLLLLVCFIFSFIPYDLMPYEIFPTVYGSTVGTVNTSTNFKSPNQKGGTLSKFANVRVTLSRNKDSFKGRNMNSSAEAAVALRQYYTGRYPNDSTYGQNTLFLIPSSEYSYYMSWSDDMSMTRSLSNVKIFEYDAGKKDLNVYDSFDNNENAGTLIVGLNNVASVSQNTFKQRVLNAMNIQDAGGIGTGTIRYLSDLKDGEWLSYLPDYNTALRDISYIYGTGKTKDQLQIEKKMRTYIELGTKSNVWEKVTKTTTNKEKVEVDLGYAAILVSLYVVAKEKGASATANTYYSAINDYFEGESNEDSPVSLITDSAICMQWSEAKLWGMAATIDMIEYSYAIDTQYTLRGEAAPSYYANGATAVKPSLNVSFSGTKGWLAQMATYSSQNIPYSMTTDSNGSIFRGFNRKWSEDPIRWARRLFTFDGGYWVINSLNNVEWYANTAAGKDEANTFAFLQSFLFNDFESPGAVGGSAINGFMISSSSVRDPDKPISIEFKVDSTVQHSEDLCDTQVKPSAPPKITLTFKANTSTIDYYTRRVNSEKDDFQGIKYDFTITRSEKKNSFNSPDVETPVELVVPALKNKSVNGNELLKLLGGEEVPINDTDILTKVYDRDPAGNNSAIYIYDIKGYIELDSIRYEFETKDCTASVSTAGGTVRYANFAELGIPMLYSEVPFPDDVGVPGEDLDYENNTQRHTKAIPTYIQSYEVSTGGEEFAEVKAGTLSGGTANEKYEAMAGVPSTEELYYSVGGSEFKVSMIAQYWVNQHSRDRTYTVHFGSVMCEYNNQEKGKGDSWEGIDLPSAAGASQTTTRFEHATSTNNGKKCGTVTVTATWTGQITNSASAVTVSNTSTHSASAHADCPAQVVNTAYVTAVSQANAWMAAMGALTPRMNWTSASDKEKREVKIDVMNMGTGNATTTQGASSSGSGSFSDRGLMTGNYNFSFSNPADTSDDDSQSVGCSASETTPCGNEQATATATATPDGPKPYTITVTYSIKEHALCGPCCEHELPELYDIWKQGLVFDTFEITQARLYKLDQGQAEGFKEILGTDKVSATVMSGNPTYFMNIARLVEKGVQANTNAPKPESGAFTTTGTGVTYANGTETQQGSASSRAGRIRYYLANQSESTKQFTKAVQGNVGSTYTVTFDPKLIAAPEQHDDVYYDAGLRSQNCDGMATTNNFGKSSSNNAKPMDKTGHVNEWADGCLYTNITMSRSYGSYHSSASAGYTVKQGKSNDSDAISDSVYTEYYNFHLSDNSAPNRGAGDTDKTSYSNKADSKDTQTPEWQFFDAARKTQIKATVITDFLILQTSGGDQSIFYYEKETDAVETQRHFPKLVIKPDEMFDNNVLSLWKQNLKCPLPESTYRIDNVENMIVVGGYNGRYDRPTDKYKPYSLVKDQFLNFNGSLPEYNTHKHSGTYNYWGNSQIKTIFDGALDGFASDPAKTISRPKKEATSQATSFKIYQENMQIIPSTANKLYTFENSKVWYSQVFAYYTTSGGSVKNAQTGGSSVPVKTQVAIGNPQRANFGNEWKTTWGNHLGIDYETTYYRIPGASGTSTISGETVNQVIVFTPVSTQYAMVMPQNDINYGAVTVSRDQRASFAFGNMNRIVNALKGCPMDPALCEFRVLNCKFEENELVATFDFEESNTSVAKNTLKGMTYSLPSGFSIQNSGKVGMGKYLYANGTRWSIPLSDLGISNNKKNRVRVEMDITVDNTSKEMMIASFQNYGFIINAQNVTNANAYFASINHKEFKGSKLDRRNLDDKLTTSEVFGPRAYGTMPTLRNTKIALVFGFNSVYDCEAYLVTSSGDIPIALKVFDLREKIDTITRDVEVLSGIQTVTATQKVVKVTDLSTEENNLPENLAESDIGPNLNIGSFGYSNQYAAQFYIDNLKIYKAGGKHTHTSSCYETTIIHNGTKTHTHTSDCYLSEPIYTCSGELNANYQLGCGFDAATTVTSSREFSYTGGMQKVTLKPGTYILEVWGARGGQGADGTTSNTSWNYGYGGHSKGTYTVTKNTDIYIYCGGMGLGNNGSTHTNGVVAGGYNGGGNAYHDGGEFGGSGGGATHIATTEGLLSSLSGKTGNILLVAGGGGGSGEDNETGGHGGSAKTSPTGYYNGSSTGGFGQGTHYVNTGESGGGGGGGYYGGYGGQGGGSDGGQGYASSVLTSVSGETGVWTGAGKAKITVQSGSFDVYQQLQTNETYTFNYTGTVQLKTLSPGKYKFQVYGAQGANGGAYGGYSYGEITFNSTTTVYIVVGGAGSGTSGGYNGGGGAASYGGGGGASHISLASGVLSNSSVYSSSNLLIVAGGGGGYAHSNQGGAGGGGNNSGSNAVYNSAPYGMGGSSSYNAGYGQGSYGSSHGGGGGGGYYGGNGGHSCAYGGGGGSGYINTSKMSNYGGSNGNRSGHGYVVITSMGHVHSGTPGLNYPNGCYTTPTTHIHNLTTQVKTLTCGIPEGGNGQVRNFSYTGTTQAVTLPAGRYKLEVWGASGGTSPGYAPGGKGGYSTGIVVLNSSTTLYVNVGQEGIQGGSGDREGWNGGAAPYTNHTYTAGGGGATDISLYGTNGTSSWNTSEHLYSRIIVAGGGGGGGAEWGAGNEYAGAGGGTNGQDAGWSGSNRGSAPGRGGTQTSAGGPVYGGFGFGGRSTTSQSGSGGGGWYGGGGQSTAPDAGGGGGSGYVYTSSTVSYYPSGCRLNSSYYLTSASTTGGNTSFTAPGGGNETGHSGNGYARITNLDHTHNDSCYSTTTRTYTCENIPAGTLMCTHELNTPFDNNNPTPNTHIHTSACLDNYKVIDAESFIGRGKTQTYTVPWSDYYWLEAYGGKSYVKTKVWLYKGLTLYINVGSSTFNNNETDIRTNPKPDSSLASVEPDAYNTAMDLYNNSILLYARQSTRGVGNSALITSNFTFTNTTAQGYSYAVTPRVSVTPVNQQPAETILHQIVTGKLSNDDVRKYLGDQLADVIINSGREIATIQNFSTSNSNGVYTTSSWNHYTVADGGVKSEITRNAIEFGIPVDIQANTVQRLRVTLVNNTASTTAKVYANGKYPVSASMLPNSNSNQTIDFDVSSAWKGEKLNNIQFDTSDSTSGTTVVKSIVFIGHYNTRSVNTSSFSNSDIITLNGFSSSDTKGFTSNSSYTTINHTTDGGSNCMVAKSTSGSVMTRWNTISSINPNAVQFIQLEFRNTSGVTGTGQLFYNSSASMNDSYSFKWNVGSTSEWQIVIIDTFNNVAYNKTTGVFTEYNYCTNRWKNLGSVTAMYLNWLDRIGTINVKSIKFIGRGSVSGTGKYSQSSVNVLTCGLVEGGAGGTYTYNYTGGEQSVTLLAGKWQLEVWGAQGGTSGYNSTKGMLGSYAKGTITLNSPTVLNIYVGGQGDSGGYNGGGAKAPYDGGAGGGATDIRKGGTALSNRIIVAGGGGGAGQNNDQGFYNAQGGYSTNGVGQNGVYDNGAGGGGYTGGYSGRGGPDGQSAGWNDEGGSAGSSYVGTLSNTSIEYQKRAGDGYAKITGLVHHHSSSCYTLTTTIDRSDVTITLNSAYGTNIVTATYASPFSQSNIETLIKENVDLIPEFLPDGVTYNPIFICKCFELNAHDCGLGCRLIAVLDCNEPHHKAKLEAVAGGSFNSNGDYVGAGGGYEWISEHYGSSNDICWDACENKNHEHDSNRDLTILNKDGQPEVAKLAEFLQLDEGFTVFFPNIGDFAGKAGLGLASPSTDRGKGYSDYMDVTEWTREKRIRFPFDVIFDGEIYCGGTWIDLDVPTVYFDFYLLSENSEMANAQIEFEVEAINCGTNVGLDITQNSSIRYTESTITTTYQNALQTFINNYLTKMASYGDAGYKVSYVSISYTFSGNSSYNKDVNGKDTGYNTFYSDYTSGKVNGLLAKMQTIGEKIRVDFAGSNYKATKAAHSKYSGARIWVHNNNANSLNQKVKPLTDNDNKEAVFNRRRSPSFQSLHGGYKTFYLDVLGRIGNFAILDSGDARFDNFFKKSLEGWLEGYEGLVKEVDRSSQENIIGDLYDIRGNRVSSATNYLNTFGTQSWANRMPKAQMLASKVNGVTINNNPNYQEEELHYGYDLITSINTLGSYQSGFVEVIPKYYAIKLDNTHIEGLPEDKQSKGSLIEVDVYMRAEGGSGAASTYPMVNAFGNAAAGKNDNMFNLALQDYQLNVDWKEEADRRNYDPDEKQRTEDVQSYFKRIIYDLTEAELEATGELGLENVDNLNFTIESIEIPTTNVQLLGNAQYMIMTGKHRTFIGSSKTVGSTINGGVVKPTKWDSSKVIGSSTLPVSQFGDANGEKNIDSVLEDISFVKAAQRWNGKIGLPSSAIFIPKGEEKATPENMKIFMNEEIDGLNDHFLILCTADMVATGDLWSISYSQPWLGSSINVNNMSIQVSSHGYYPGHRVTQPVYEDGSYVKYVVRNGVYEFPTDGTGELADSSIASMNPDWYGKLTSAVCPNCLPPIIAVYGSSSTVDVEVVHTH